MYEATVIVCMESLLYWQFDAIVSTVTTLPVSPYSYVIEYQVLFGEVFVCLLQSVTMVAVILYQKHIKTTVWGYACDKYELR